jgi:ABC-type molybdate transport system substrate-binding protein
MMNHQICTTYTEIKLIGALPVRAPLSELLQIFQNAHHMAISTEFNLNSQVVEYLLAGLPFDLAIVNPENVYELIRNRRIDPDSHASFGRIPLAIARRGSISGMVYTSMEDLRTLLRQARSIAYSAEGSSGASFLDVVQRISIAEDIAQRLRPMAPGRALHAVAQGQVELAIAPLTNVIAAPGLDVSGIFPVEMEADIEMAMVLGVDAAGRCPVRQLVDFLADPGIDSHLAAKGIFRSRLA